MLFIGASIMRLFISATKADLSIYCAIIYFSSFLV